MPVSPGHSSLLIFMYFSDAQVVLNIYYLVDVKGSEWFTNPNLEIKL